MLVAAADGACEGALAGLGDVRGAREPAERSQPAERPGVAPFYLQGPCPEAARDAGSLEPDLLATCRTQAA